MTRRGLLAGIVASALAACGRGGSDEVPAGDAWRTEVVDAIQGTPGVANADIRVADVDSGTGQEGPHVEGGVHIPGGDVQPVVDELVRRVTDVLGQESSGVYVNIRVRTDDRLHGRLSDYGYPSPANGRQLYDAVHG